MKKIFRAGSQRSPWVIQLNCASCNGCDCEVMAAFGPVYDLERFGAINVGDPKHADILLVTGGVNQRAARVLRNTYEQMPHPKRVIAVGACACSGGIFRECPDLLGGVDKVIPVDIYLPGCSPRPEAILDALAAVAQGPSSLPPVQAPPVFRG